MPRALHRDESAAFPVFEAVLVALLIITTIIFFTSLQRPTTATDQGGIDLGRLASDTLGVLQTKPIAATACPAGVLLPIWVGHAMNGTTCEVNQVEKFLAEVLPIGTQFQLRFDNGIESTVLVPYGSKDVPRAGRAAATYINPFWLAFASQNPADRVFPGMEIGSENVNATAFTTFPSIKCIKSPLGTATGPAGASWLSVWQTNSTPKRVPPTIPYGIWAGYPNADCSGTAQYVGVGLPDGSLTNYPVYGIQLVVWFGA